MTAVSSQPSVSHSKLLARKRCKVKYLAVRNKENALRGILRSVSASLCKVCRCEGLSCKRK